MPSLHFLFAAVPGWMLSVASQTWKEIGCSWLALTFPRTERGREDAAGHIPYTCVLPASECIHSLCSHGRCLLCPLQKFPLSEQDLHSFSNSQFSLMFLLNPLRDSLFAFSPIVSPLVGWHGQRFSGLRSRGLEFWPGQFSTHAISGKPPHSLGLMFFISESLEQMDTWERQGSLHSSLLLREWPVGHQH